MKLPITILAALFLAALALSFAGAWHPVGDSLAVFRLGLAAMALMLIWCSGWGRALRLAGAGACGLALATIGWHKLPLQDPGPLTVYQKNMFYRNTDLPGLAADIAASGADIVTLQEVSVANETLLDMLRDIYPQQHLCRFTSRSGLAVLSRLAVTDTPVCNRRVGLAGLRLSAPSGAIWALSVHMSWPYPKRQPIQIARLARALPDFNAPVVIGGDFNMVPWSNALARVARAGGLRRAGPSRPTFQLGALPLPIDHVFAPGGGTTRARPRLGSDHRGVLARVRR